ncbi:hypothetical protein Tco_0364030 [Tanacetum coccineum]
MSDSEHSTVTYTSISNDYEEPSDVGSPGEDEGEDEEEEEHLALADSIPPPAYRTTARMSIRAQTHIPFPSEAEIPSPPFPIPSPLTTSPTDAGAPLGYRAIGIRYVFGYTLIRDRRDPDREIGYEITDVWEDPDEIAEEIPTTDVAELGQRMTDFVTTRLGALILAMARLIIVRPELLRVEAWVQSNGCYDRYTSGGLKEQRTTKCLPRKAPRTRTTPATATATTPMTDAAIRALISRGVADALAEQEIQRNNNLNGDGSQGSRSGITKLVRPTRELSSISVTVQSRTKLSLLLAPFMVKGTDFASYTQRFQELALLSEDCFRKSLDKIKKYAGGLPDMIHGSVMASKPKTMQDAVEFAT